MTYHSDFNVTNNKAMYSTNNTLPSMLAAINTAADMTLHVGFPVPEYINNKGLVTGCGNKISAKPSTEPIVVGVDNIICGAGLTSNIPNTAVSTPVSKIKLIGQSNTYIGTHATSDILVIGNGTYITPTDTLLKTGSSVVDTTLICGNSNNLVGFPKSLVDAIVVPDLYAQPYLNTPGPMSDGTANLLAYAVGGANTTSATFTIVTTPFKFTYDVIIGYSNTTIDTAYVTMKENCIRGLCNVFSGIPNTNIAGINNSISNTVSNNNWIILGNGLSNNNSTLSGNGIGVAAIPALTNQTALGSNIKVLDSTITISNLTSAINCTTSNISLTSGSITFSNNWSMVYNTGTSNIDISNTSKVFSIKNSTDTTAISFTGVHRCRCVDGNLTKGEVVMVTGKVDRLSGDYMERIPSISKCSYNHMNRVLGVVLNGPLKWDTPFNYGNLAMLQQPNENNDYIYYDIASSGDCVVRVDCDVKNGDLLKPSPYKDGYATISDSDVVTSTVFAKALNNSFKGGRVGCLLML